MAYIEGFVCAVPAANKDIYREHAAKAAPLFQEFGVARMVENWADDVPDGKVTDFKGAVKAKPDEVVVFSWFEFPDKATRNAANQKMTSDPRMEQMGETMPMDGQRMIVGGFEVILDEKAGGKMGYVDGTLLAVPADKREAYLQMAVKTAAILKEHGASRVVEAWGDEVPEGKVTDYQRAVKASPGETIVYSWIEWPSKAARDEGWAKVMADPRMETAMADRPYDGQRQVYGGFAPLLDL